MSFVSVSANCLLRCPLHPLAVVQALEAYGRVSHEVAVEGCRAIVSLAVVSPSNITLLGDAGACHGKDISALPQHFLWFAIGNVVVVHSLQCYRVMCCGAYQRNRQIYTDTDIYIYSFSTCTCALRNLFAALHIACSCISIYSQSYPAWIIVMIPSRIFSRIFSVWQWLWPH